MKALSCSLPCATTLLCLLLLPVMAQSAGEPSELERLRAENQALREQLSQVQGKTSPSKSEPGAASHKSTISEDLLTTDHSSVRTYLDKIFLRSSVFDEDVLAPGQITDPAQITYVHPGHGRDTYAIDAGLAFTFITPKPGDWQIDWGIGADYHRNTDTASLKDLWQTGFLADAILGNPAESSFFLRIKANASYKDDNIKDLEAIVGGIDFIPIVALLGMDNYHRLGPAHWRWQPFAGLRYESSISTGIGVEEGHRLLARYGAEAQIFPLFDYVKRTIEASCRYTMWSDLDSTGIYHGKNWNGYFESSLTYWFNGGLSVNKEKMDIGVSVSYENGDNPELDLAKVDLLTVSLKAKF